MSISEKEEYLDKNHHISQVIVPINMATDYHRWQTSAWKTVVADTYRLETLKCWS